MTTDINLGNTKQMAMLAGYLAGVVGFATYGFNLPMEGWLTITTQASAVLGMLALVLLVANRLK